MTLHHVGYLVKHMDKAILAFEKLGVSLHSNSFDDDRKAQICFLVSPDGGKDELVSPTVDSDIYPLLKKYTNCPYHVCYQVQNLDAAIAEYTESGFLLFKEPSRALAISPTAQVAFLMHAQIGIIELLQL